MTHVQSVPCNFIEYHCATYNNICVGMVPQMFCLYTRIYMELLLYICIYNVDPSTSMGLSPPICVVLPIPVVLISVASRHEYYLIRHSFDEDSPLYDQVKA